MEAQPTRVNFRPTFFAGPNAVVVGDEIEGESVSFGLVLHPFIEGTAAVPVLATDGTTAISDPVTGSRVACGYSRQQAIEHLAQLVRKYGGPEAFEQLLARRRETILARRAAELAAEPTPSPTADVRAVICPEE